MMFSRRSFLSGLSALAALVGARVPVKTAPAVPTLLPPEMLPPVTPAGPEFWGLGLDGEWRLLSRTAEWVEAEGGRLALTFQNLERTMTITEWEVRKASDGEWLVRGMERDMSSPHAIAGCDVSINIGVDGSLPEPVRAAYAREVAVAVNEAALADVLM
jgi:hypothetical protein